LHAGRRVWAVASVHGEAARLSALHDELARRFLPGDRLVYLGNYLGYGPAIRETVDELLRFRCALIASPGMFAFDVAYLRGSQEEMWQKLLQLQFAPNPREVLTWMMRRGVDATLAAYEGDPEQGMIAARDSALTLTRWTSSLRSAMQRAPGHYALMTALRRAAYTADGALLFVNAGVDPDRPLSAQSDALWWGSAGFAAMREPYGGFRAVVAGYDQTHPGLVVGAYRAVVDAGAGFGGPLIAACFEHGGEPVDLIEC
jgi:serine/threonine protein phosphatase 1